MAQEGPPVLSAAIAVAVAVLAGTLALTARVAASTPVATTVAAAPAEPESAPTPPPAVPPTTTPAPTERVSLAFTGDLLTHTSVSNQAGANHGGGGYDYSPMFSAVAGLLEPVDLAICHLEVPLSRDGAEVSGYPVFNAPPELATAVAGAGWDACSTASNHSLDKGPGGVEATLDVLDGATLGHAGTARNPIEADHPVLYDAGGDVQVGHVSASYGFNGFTPDEPWRVNDLNPDRLITQSRAARDAGADIVVVSLHWGVEYQSDPTADQRALAQTLATSGAVDVIVGHHAHVVQPIEQIGDTIVIYGLGNFLSSQSAACCAAATQDGMIVEVNLERDPDAARFTPALIEFVPTLVRRPDFQVVPVAQMATDPGVGVAAADLRASWDRTVSVVGTTGVAVPRGAPPGTT